MWPLSRLMPETRTSAFGALATIVPSESRTTMSRRRTAVAAGRGALDLRAADLDAMIVAEILRDGGGKPGRHDVELDRTGRKPPPQREAARNENDAEDAEADRRAAQEATVAPEKPPKP